MGLPRRLVVGVDGLGYAEVQAAQAAGAFRQFFPVSRMISTFPSISDIAWSEIFGVSPPPGYQRVYFRLDEGRKVGGPIDPIRPIEFERRMDLGFEQKAHHISSYMSPVRTARHELSTLSRVFFSSGGIETFYAYLPAPDALQHVRGSVSRYLGALDHEITTILDLYRHRTGTDLELVLVSDHGNNQRWDAETIDLEQFLNDRGYRAGDKIARPAEVAFSTDGVTTGVGVFVGPREVEPLANVLATLRGVEFVTAVVRRTRGTHRTAGLGGRRCDHRAPRQRRPGLPAGRRRSVAIRAARRRSQGGRAAGRIGVRLPTGLVRGVQGASIPGGPRPDRAEGITT